MARRGENIYKRKDGRWEGRYIKGRRPNGRIHYGYIYGKKYTEVKYQLVLIKSQTQTQEMSGLIAYDGNLRDWAYYWLEHLVHPKVKSSTYTSYRNKMELHVLPIIGNISLQKLKKENIDHLLSKLRENLKASSIRSIYSVLTNCIEKAVTTNLLLVNPCKGVELPRAERKTVQALSVTDQKKLVQAISQNKHFFSILLALQTGLRIGEICGLKWEDIDFENDLLWVKRTVQRMPSHKKVGSKTTIIEVSPKSMTSKRKIPLTKLLKEQLLELKEKSNSDYVISNKSRAMEPRAIAYRFQVLRKKIGLEDFSFHSLRHTFATRCLEAGGNIAAISSLLGHSSIKMTLDCYTNSFFTEERQLVEKLNFV